MVSDVVFVIFLTHLSALASHFPFLFLSSSMTWKDPCYSKRCPPFAQCVSQFGAFARCVCPTKCSLVYDPICGTDRKSYFNLCALQLKACHSNVTISVAYKGTCGMGHFRVVIFIGLTSCYYGLVQIMGYQINLVVWFSVSFNDNSVAGGRGRSAQNRIRPIRRSHSCDRYPCLLTQSKSFHPSTEHLCFFVSRHELGTVISGGN